MDKVTRIAYSKHLNQGKYERLAEIARRVGKIRAEVWRRYGSVQGVEMAHRQIRDQWLGATRLLETGIRKGCQGG